jgi:hypothetical protein
LPQRAALSIMELNNIQGPLRWQGVFDIIVRQEARNKKLVQAVLDGALEVVKDIIDQDNSLARHTLNRKTTLLVRGRLGITSITAYL